MPLVHSVQINEAHVNVWHITEEVDFFLNKIGHLENIKSSFTKISNTSKQKEFLASRYLLFVTGGEDYISMLHKTETGKPFLKNNYIKISLSHTQQYAVLIESLLNCGIDMERINERVKKIAVRFLHEQEWAFIKHESETELLTLFWSAKEAIYKWYGKRSLIFNTQIILQEIQFEKDDYQKGILLYQLLADNSIKKLPVHFEKLADHYITAIAIELA